MIVLDALEYGKLKYVLPGHLDNKFDRASFNMGLWMNYCGTVGCIGGWAEEFGHCSYDYDNNPQLEELFFPTTIRRPIRSITAEEAARALRNYLETGEARWQEVVR